MKTLDVIVPIYNEAEVLGALFAALDEAFSAPNLAKRNLTRVRYLFIDDGSSDTSARIISERIKAGAPAALYRLSRNFGHQNAVCAGLDHATADFVAILDADLRTPARGARDGRRGIETTSSTDSAGAGKRTSQAARLLGLYRLLMPSPTSKFRSTVATSA